MKPLQRFCESPADAPGMWQLWRYEVGRSLSGEYSSRAEAERGAAMLKKLFPQSQFKIAFTGKFMGGTDSSSGF